MSKFCRFINSKELCMRGCLLNFSKYKAGEILIYDKCVFGEYGVSINLGFLFDYRTGKTHHKGVTVIFNLIFWALQLDFHDKRHVAEYEKI